MNDVQLRHDVLKLDDIYQKVMSEECGATSLFVGSTRNNSENRVVGEKFLIHAKTKTLKSNLMLFIYGRGYALDL